MHKGRFIRLVIKRVDYEKNDFPYWFSIKSLSNGFVAIYKPNFGHPDMKVYDRYAKPIQCRDDYGFISLTGEVCQS